MRSAEVLVIGGRSVRSDSAGNFAIAKLPNGSVRILIRAFGYQPVELALDVRGDEDIQRLVALDSSAVAKKAQELPTVSIIDAQSSYRLADFERRRRTGRGHYLTEDDIESSGARDLQGAVRGIRGVDFECRADAVCRIHMARAPNNCDPQYIVDTRVDNMFGPLTPIGDIVGVEIYTGPSDVPGEYAGRDAGCGVIVIWTRSGPTRKQE